MDLELFETLSDIKDKKEKVNILMCNEFGQIGTFKNIVITEVDRKENKITAKVKCKENLNMDINFVLDNAAQNRMNSYHAIMIKRAKRLSVENNFVYTNPKANELLHSTKKYSFHMDQPYIKTWEKDKAIKFLLANLGQYVTIAEGRNRYNGIVKSVEYDVKNGKSLVMLIQSSRVLRPHVITNKCKLVSYKDKSVLEYNKVENKEMEL